MCEYGYLNNSSTGKRDEAAIAAMFSILPCESVTVEQLWSRGEKHRPAFEELMEKLQPGDTLYIHSIDRLGVDVRDTVSMWNMITRNIKANIVVMDTPGLDTRSNPEISEANIRTAAKRAFAQIEAEKNIPY